jgi:polar amino acid transport system substrate-binding protein
MRKIKRVKKCTSIALSLGLLISSAGWAHAQDPAKCEPAKLKEKYPSLVGKTINVALDGLQRPFTYHDPQDPNKIIGVDIDLMTATFDCLGVPWKQSIGVWAGLITSVTEGRNDIMWDTLNYTPARAKQVNYVLYLSAATGFLVHAGNPKHVNSLDTICGLAAAAGLGTVEEAAFHDQGKKCVSMGKPDLRRSRSPQGHQPRCQAGRSRRHHGAERLGQEHTATSRQPPRIDELRRDHGGRQACRL